VPNYFPDPSIVRHTGDDTVVCLTLRPFVPIDIDDASWAEWKYSQRNGSGTFSLPYTVQPRVFGERQWHFESDPGLPFVAT
jgi:hypothetical protein